MTKTGPSRERHNLRNVADELEEKGEMKTLEKCLQSMQQMGLIKGIWKQTRCRTGGSKGKAHECA